ncbi:hypothetical protein RICGR_0322 [Rickettsiella grylli]|uniref:Uncharacterized protein n=1 Tax=Rickettsiella grylli TaxID=59196 RepID=A8PK66_9COXI|nr:hypothetical protein RICGR_0322 [Rickettsiella grylli]
MKQWLFPYIFFEHKNKKIKPSLTKIFQLVKFKKFSIIECDSNNGLLNCYAA